MNSEEKLLQYMESNSDYNSPEFKKNLQKFIDKSKRDSKRLDTILKQSDKQQKRLLQLNDELDTYKNHLEIKVEEEIQKRKENEKMLLQQSKMAAMGEMIDAIAHQWKQPLSVINLKVGLVEYDYDDNLVNKEYIKILQKQIIDQTEHMSDTLDNFRSFFRPDKEVKEFNITSMIENVLLLIKDDFRKYNINISINTIDDFNLLGIENEFQHLVINILNNSKDAFHENNISNRYIHINILNKNALHTIEFIDNAGGIPSEFIPNIFNANYTTKKNGTGIGMYMSKLISDKHGGTLKVDNFNEGARFIFEKKLEH